MEISFNENEILEYGKTLTLVDAKKIAKYLKIKSYYVMKKKDVVKNILTLFSAVKIQRAFRKTKIEGEKCPISLEEIRYPLYPYPIGGGIFRYYNIVPLKKYLLESGNFCDPTTRTPYEDHQLREMDFIDEYSKKISGFGLPGRGKGGEEDKNLQSVLLYSKKKKYYTKKQNRENDILVLERVLDMSCQDIINTLVSNSLSYNIFEEVDTIYIRNYETNFYRMLEKDREHAKYMINKNINNILCIVEYVGMVKMGMYTYVLNRICNIKDSNF